jgi:hypothetical protein
MSEIKHTPEGWDHKDVWRRRGKDFLLEVTRHAAISSEWEGPHRWAVYAYIYPKHPHFSAFSGPAMYQDASSQLFLHGGPSLLEYPMYEGKVTCVKVGADYHHLHDDRFTHYATATEARDIFEDADELFVQLTSIAERAVGSQS